MALKPASEEPLDLDVDLTQVDTSMPVFPAGLVDLRIHDMTKEKQKEGDGHNLLVIFSTTEDMNTIQKPDGPPVKAGFALRRYFPLQAKSDAADKEQWKKGLAELVDAALGTSLEAGNRPGFSKGLLLNKVVRANLKVGDFNGRPTNEVGILTHPGGAE